MIKNTAGQQLNIEAPEYGEHDSGPWVVGPDGRTLDSEDFTHDVQLKVIGDFFNSEQRKRYADNLAVKLNNKL